MLGRFMLRPHRSGKSPLTPHGEYVCFVDDGANREVGGRHLKEYLAKAYPGVRGFGPDGEWQTVID